jgi:regulation of enolase protein 1 (concanavalin A-like superfamily)
VTADLAGLLPFPLREYGPQAPWSYDGGTLSVRTGPREDRFVPPAGEALDPASDAPRLLGTPPAGDFQLIARVTVDFAGAFDAGLLYLHVSEREWAKLCLELSPDKPTICTVVTRGHSDDVNSWVVDGNSVWLRISRTGKAFAFHASLDGERWTFVRVFALGDAESAPQPAEVGFMAQAPVGEGCAVSWDSVEYRAYAPKDLRDGS